MSHYNQHSIASESQHHLKQDLSTYLRDDPSFTETLTLIDFFFDEDLIKEHDCNRLHNALDKIRCHNTAQPLGGNILYISVR
jgi:hypothetical protein